MVELRICEGCNKVTREPLVIGAIFKRYFCSVKCYTRVDGIEKLIGMLHFLVLLWWYEWLKARFKKIYHFIRGSR